MWAAFDQVALKFMRAGIPARTRRPLAAGFGIDLERSDSGACQISVQRPGHAVFDHIDRPGYGVGRDWNSTGHGLEIHQAKSISEAREYQDVSGRQMRGQILSKL